MSIRRLLSAALAVGPLPAAAVPTSTLEILVTAEDGRRLARVDDVRFRVRQATGPTIRVFPEEVRQTIEGIGSSFTESAAFVLAHLEPELRREVMRRIWSEDGANFSMARTHIGSCDFSVEGKYSYAETPGDTELASFSIAPDRAGFDPQRYPGVRTPDYDLLPMIEEALTIKAAQDDSTLKIVASAWTAPPWMKDIGTWFVPASAENAWQGTGGSLKPEYVDTYARYLVKYLDAYAAAGVRIWGLTPVNEPNGNAGFWESMHFTPESQNDFVKRHLGPALAASAHDVELLVYDQNRDDLERWTEAILDDPESKPFVDGIAVHWYSSTVDVYEDVLARVHARYPDTKLVHTEGCIDNLGVEAPGGVLDPVGFREEGWFGDDSFWWNRNATDWGYSATWLGEKAADHPMYVPVHRYARDIIVGIDHGLGGWIDWNVVLDRDGGPNHVGNFCGAPIMIDTATQEVHYTPVFAVLEQLSRTIRPGDRALRTEHGLDGLGDDDLRACATIDAEGVISVQLLNTTERSIAIDLDIAGAVADVVVPANAVQTVRVRW